MSNHAAFFTAVKVGALDETRDMLAADPELIRVRIDGATALHMAAVGNQREMVDILLERGADLNFRDHEYHMTPIGWANEEGHAGMVAYLSERGAGMDLVHAAGYGLLARVHALVAADRTSVNRQVGNWPPLHHAALWGHADVVEALLGYGADPHLRDGYGRTALVVALGQVQTDCTATPLVRGQRRQEIRAGCERIVELLRAKAGQG